MISFTVTTKCIKNLGKLSQKCVGPKVKKIEDSVRECKRWSGCSWIQRPSVENMSVSYELAVIQYSSKQIMCELKKKPHNQSKVYL